MIPVAILCAALSLPANFSGVHRDHDIQIFRMLASQVKGAHSDLSDSQWQRGPNVHVLVLGHHSRLVDRIRDGGLSAWLLNRYPSDSPYGIQARLDRSPIKRRSIQVTAVIQALSDINEVCAVLGMVAPGGFLLVDIMVNQKILNLMHERDWEYLPFKWHFHSIFRRAA